MRRASLLDTDGLPDDDNEIRMLVATLQGKPKAVVRLAVRAAQAIVNECEAIDIESGPPCRGLDPTRGHGDRLAAVHALCHGADIGEHGARPD